MIRHMNMLYIVKCQAQEGNIEKKKEITSYFFDTTAWNSYISGSGAIFYVVF